MRGLLMMIACGIGDLYITVKPVYNIIFSNIPLLRITPSALDESEAH